MLKVWWSTSPSLGNFGDILTTRILNHYGIAHRWVPKGQADTICCGSIIRFARSGVQVLGSGAISERDPINPTAAFLWVRGPLTACLVRRAGGYCPDVYGDPAMLLPRILPRTVEPVHEVGVFAHYADLEAVQGHPVVINPLEPVPVVLRKLWTCKRIVSSSLHGIIAAHAYGIPAAFVRLGNRLAGDGLKFDDYAQSVGLSHMPLSTVDSPDFTVATYDDTAIHNIMAGLSG